MTLTKISKKNYLMVLIFIAIFLLGRLPMISRDEINPDGVNWHYRMQQFVVGLKTGQLEKTYQHYHPGVTLMWIAGIPVEMYKQITGITTYDMNNFQSFNLVAKTSVIIVQLVLSLLAIYLFSKIVGFKISLLTLGLLSIEPFFLGNSRLFHMDVLLALFTFNALLVSYLSLRDEKKVFVLLSGILLTLSFLTKSIGIGAFSFVFLYSLLFLIAKNRLRFFKSYFPILISSFVISLFLFFPAMFKGPVFYLSEIFSESQRIGIRNGHGQIVFGQFTNEAGLNFYPLVLLMKVSPFTVAGLLFLVLSFLLKRGNGSDSKKNILLSPILFLTIFYFAYFIVMSLPTKKIDRYMLPVYPLLSYFAVVGYSKLYLAFPKIKKLLLSLTTVLLVFFVLYPDIKIFPYLFTYTSPIFGTTENANRIIAQKPFGIGIFDMKNSIVQKYGGKAKLGFIDVKPIEAIYPNSQVFDMRETGPGGYDYAVLGINESFPEKILNDTRFRFEKDYSIIINGLEYWRVYVKRNI